MARILVAEDDPKQLELRARLLEAGGHEVAVAFCPSEALRQLSAAEVVILDLRFPNSRGEPDAAEGLTLIRKIRESGCTAPLIVISGWPGDLDEQPEARLVSKVMVKPVRMATLLEAVSAVSAPSQSPPSGEP